jgi:hypothetical protein
MNDGARQFGAELDIDLKTCNASPGKCPGTISVPPSPGKTWIRTPWEHGILPMPSAFIDFFLAGFDRNLKAGMRWLTTRPTDESVKFTTQDAPRKINVLMDAYSDSIRNALHAKLGLTNVLLMINNLQVIINNNNNQSQTPPPAEERHDDEELISMLLSSQVTVKQRWRFSPDAKSANCNGLYYCDPATNM